MPTAQVLETRAVPRWNFALGPMRNAGASPWFPIVGGVLGRRPVGWLPSNRGPLGALLTNADEGPGEADGPHPRLFR